MRQWTKQKHRINAKSNKGYQVKVVQPISKLGLGPSTVFALSYVDRLSSLALKGGGKNHIWFLNLQASMDTFETPAKSREKAWGWFQGIDGCTEKAFASVRLPLFGQAFENLSLSDGDIEGICLACTQITSLHLGVAQFVVGHLLDFLKKNQHSIKGHDFYLGRLRGDAAVVKLHECAVALGPSQFHPCLRTIASCDIP